MYKLKEIAEKLCIIIMHQIVEKGIISVNMHYLLLFFRDIYERKLTLEEADN